MEKCSLMQKRPKLCQQKKKRKKEKNKQTSIHLYIKKPILKTLFLDKLFIISESWNTPKDENQKVVNFKRRTKHASWKMKFVDVI